MTHDFCDHCPGCRPALINPDTGRPLADDSPYVRAVNRVWDHETTFAQRRAFIMVTVHNSRDALDLLYAKAVVDRFTAAIP